MSISHDTIPTSSRRGLLVVFLCVAAVAAVVAIPSLLNGFVYDDTWIVERNELIHSLHWGELLTSTYWPEGRSAIFWRPAAIIGFAVQWAIGGGAPVVFHVTNMLLYALCCGLVGMLCARLFDPRVGAVAGVLFAVHPVHVEVFANVVGQAELWAALGYLGAMFATWERSRTHLPLARSALLLSVVACLTLGLAGKEQPVTFPGAIVVLWWLRAKNESIQLRSVAKREWLVAVVSCAVIAVYLGLRAEFGGGVAAAGGIATGLDPDSAFRRIVVMLPVTLTWLRVLFFPLALSADYSPMHLVPQTVFGVNHALAIVVWSGLLALTFLVRERMSAVFVGFLLFAVTISVVSNVVVPLEVLMAERLLFLPSVGWALATAGVLQAGYVSHTDASQRRTLTVLVGLFVVLLAVRSLQRVTIWRNNDVFFATLIDDAPDSFRSHWAKGHFAFEQGDSALGERELQIAVRLNSEHPQLLEDFGRLYAATGHYEPSIPLLSHAVAIDSTRLSSALPLALALARTGKTSDALTVLDAMSRLHGETRGIALVRGEVLMRAADFDAALSVLIGLVEREPDVWSIRVMAAEAALQAGLCEVALAQADTALQLAPDAERTSIETLRLTIANGKTSCK